MSFSSFILTMVSYHKSGTRVKIFCFFYHFFIIKFLNLKVKLISCLLYIMGLTIIITPGSFKLQNRGFLDFIVSKNFH